MAGDGKQNAASFVSAGVMPWKLLRSREAIVDGVIRPYHLQLTPTNRCNAKCPWCSCQNVDRRQEMGADELRALLNHFWGLGTRALTVTGGGEPTLHPAFDDIIHYAHGLGMHIGLVTNGIRWSKGEGLLSVNSCLTWIRMSITDTESGFYDADMVARVAKRIPSVDMGISFTVSKKVSLKTAVDIARVAEATKNITHIRYVEEIVHGAQAEINLVEKACSEQTKKGIYQQRSGYSAGFKKCYMSKLKPMIDPEGWVQPCCGTQYAAGGEAQSLNFPPEFRMCHWRDYKLETAPFNGSVCRKCFYDQYQNVLHGLCQPLVHERFV